MSTIDWIVLSSTLAFIVIYGIWKTYGANNATAYLKGDNNAKWWLIGFSVMATQASAITFLSTPGQAFADGMGFVQIYFGLPIAILVICVFFIPIYYRQKVYTAYEYLENRFDRKNRVLASILFLIQRGMGAGITIFAPAIILSTIMGWNLRFTCIIIGSLVIAYTVSGGTKAVSHTQLIQMFVIFAGMFITFGYLLNYLPDDMSFKESLAVAAASDKMKIIDFNFDINSRYTFWSGITGGFFLSLAYFGTDQSQVQRYLGGKSIKESRLGLLFNAILKIPMQFFILLCGILVFVFFQFHQSPVFFNEVATEGIEESAYAEEYNNLQNEHEEIFQENQVYMAEYLEGFRSGEEAKMQDAKSKISANKERQIENKAALVDIIESTSPNSETNDKDYVFIYFITHYLPRGLIGLLLAVIFSAAMSSTAAELNALASTTTMDIYKRNFAPNLAGQSAVRAAKLFTLMWGLIAIGFALSASLFENLIQFVNIIGSLFYGTVLGMFLLAFFFKKMRGFAVFPAAIITELAILGYYGSSQAGWVPEISFLWFNLIGAAGTVLLALIMNLGRGESKKENTK